MSNISMVRGANYVLGFVGVNHLANSVKNFYNNDFNLAAYNFTEGALRLSATALGLLFLTSKPSDDSRVIFSFNAENKEKFYCVEAISFKHTLKHPQINEQNYPIIHKHDCAIAGKVAAFCANLGLKFNMSNNVNSDFSTQDCIRMIFKDSFPSAVFEKILKNSVKIAHEITQLCDLSTEFPVTSEITPTQQFQNCLKDTLEDQDHVLEKVVNSSKLK